MLNQWMRECSLVGALFDYRKAMGCSPPSLQEIDAFLGVARGGACETVLAQRGG